MSHLPLSFLPFSSAIHSCNSYLMSTSSSEAASPSTIITSSSSSATETPGGATGGFVPAFFPENAPLDLALAEAFLPPPLDPVVRVFGGLCDACSC